ncbi:efflux RND transporter periplasmic adaptor subunit [Extensimonas vulgaris]|uniref:HlyD family secretion protein n=1 Tax=Extensimonas vulgaris TaxID=1031594 RepID=A0A369AJC3_9BURK|nr:efflux RND transporter periplasmic adaptor subunit [Extensimonas vulgaris]RCX09482.1 HlyD family secretion protein [Extensimonas vulgaris]TWI38612.1 HlyD family secretion protein [Extensimonas vulgaris]TXD14534.1 efflux RND transporter periplasmic adaptor subunit [Extensimonas vulgaris]
MTSSDPSASPAPVAAPTAQTRPSAAELKNLLGDGLVHRWWQRPGVWLGLFALVLVAGGAYYWRVQQSASAAPSYVTEALRRGNITLSVMANGILQPTRSVAIGSELSGTVRDVFVDVNDRVKKGQVLIVLDTAKLEAQVQRSRATLAAAQARLAQAAATTKEAQANYARLQEVARLSGGKVPSAAELDTGLATLLRAQADEASARASVQDARAALSTDETNLSKASIRSPIDGVVLSRSVEPGNAVAASLQAVTLLMLAEDLTHLRVYADVDEADVGVVQVGQKSSFTVSAYPTRRFPAEVTRVSFGSTKTDNVVTYTTWLDVDNHDLALRPGMTATATIVATERKGVLLVPNTALRFTPTQVGAAGAAGAASTPGAAKSGGSGGGIMAQLMPHMPRNARKAGTVAKGPAAAGPGSNERQLWLLKDGQPQPVRVQVGISDGRVTEVSGDGLQPGMAVIVDQRRAGAKP